MIKNFKDKNEYLRDYNSELLLKILNQTSKEPKNNNDKEYVRSICLSVMNMQFELENMPLKERDNNIIKNLHIMEERGNFDWG